MGILATFVVVFVFKIQQYSSVDVIIIVIVYSLSRSNLLQRKNMGHYVKCIIYSEVEKFFKLDR